jgi:hypothetical protein
MSAEPVEPPLIGPERAMLAGWLDYHRAILLAKCAASTMSSASAARSAPR